ncbi:MAG: GH3 auxin-responsive promoter family protein [Chlorobi bacterium]|nr:GH3 auxin-responsive promoter family protein [Chlorobiota bacterium]
MPLLNSIYSWLMIKRRSQIELFKKYPFDVQQETLLKLIKKAKDTEWGKQYNFTSIKNIKEFQQAVPLQDYDTIKGYVERLRNGEKNLLWPGEIKWFAKSSGTTSDKSKFIPVSKDALEDCHFRGGKDVLAIYADSFPDSKIFNGKSLALGGTHQINNFSNDSYYGDLSAILIQNIPFWVEFSRTPDNSIALMDEWEEKIDLMAHATIKENVTTIAGVPSWTLVLIKKILEITNKTNLLEVWPDLELFVHGGVNFGPYRDQFKKLIPSEKMNYMETYNASEGFFAIQDDLQSDDMLLLLDAGIFYEFIPMNQIHEEHPTAYTLENVEIGKNYAIVITTNGGLWRYIIGDTVVFTSKFPFKIKVSGRTKHYINTFGEELIIDNADKAIQLAAEKTNSQILEYTAAPVFMSLEKKGSHQWLIEFEKQPKDLDYFASVLDNELKSLNSDYEAKRYKNMTLDFPTVQIAKPGTFYQWLKEIGKLGGQHKVPRLSNNRKFIDQIIAINNKRS